MTRHELWHITVLATTLLAAASLGIVGLAPLLFGSRPDGVRKALPVALLLGGIAIALLIVEWLVVHGG